MLNLSSLNPQQRQAVETLRGPVLILAGAGTGKTRVITYRIAQMVERGIASGNILGVTFTNKAAREMQERVTKLLPKKKTAEDGKRPERPTICTFHSLCVRILRQHIEKLGYKRNFVIYDESEQLAAVKKILSGISNSGEKADPGAVLGMLSKFKNGGERSAVFGDPNVRALAEHVSKRYESALHACNAVDFDDLILLTLRLFREHPEALAACREKFRYVMVDEYQDTNASQFELVHALTKEHRNFCVVGDDDQSIYGWRGAEIANLLNLEEHFPEVKIIKLEQNYRSTSTILNAANAIIKHNVRRRSKTLWSGKGAGAKIKLQAYNNDEDEAREVAAQVEFNRIAHRIPWRDCAILFRTNQQSRPLETALRTVGVRYHLIGGQSFFDRREIKDFLAYLKMLLNPDDDISLLRIANVPARGLSEVTMERLLAASQERKCSVFAAMKNPLVAHSFQKNTRESIEAFVEFVERVRGQLTDNPHPDPLPSEAKGNRQRAVAENPGTDRPTPVSGSTKEGQGRGGGAFLLQTWADHFLNETGYFAELQRLDKDPEVSEARIRGLRELMSTMDGVGNAPLERLQNFLENVTLDSEGEEEKENTSDAVTLITMHSCKGLEFPHVFIVGLEDGLLPHSRSKAEGTLDEERRLFYVAVTRAMQTLAISHCGGRKKYGQLQPCHPSPFLQELPEELVEHFNPKSNVPVPQESGKNLFAAMRAAIS
ncbi:MAG TPA: UvrD-helicase domain-containing protein [Candidatus Acidoferrales bacterium]|nr:UvrD-helicase domain-containing protein [Candidatus Acidoferrales bacterium]